MADRVYAYYPGCTLHNTAKEYDVSTRLVCYKLGIELREIEDWTCCGASSAHSVSYLLGIALPARDLQKTEEMKLPLVTPCPACFSRMKFAIHELRNTSTLEAVNQIIGKSFRNSVTVEPLLRVLDEGSVDVPISKPLEGLRVACYYGCLFVRPRSVLEFDDEDNPMSMDRIIQRLGAESIDWGLKTDCCGGGMAFARPDMVYKLSHRIISIAKRLGADCIAVACPMCHASLDMYQKQMESLYNEKVNMPIIYFTQLMGLAMNISAKELLLDKHIADPMPMLKSKGLV